MPLSLRNAMSWLEPYDGVLFIVGLATLATAILPRLLASKPLSLPIALLALGALASVLPLGLPRFDPIAHPKITERLTELTVLVSLMGAGIKLDRKVGVRTWSTTWRLLLVAMPLTILLFAVLGATVGGFTAATAALLGAVIAPTDPVLAAEVHVGAPGHGSTNAETAEPGELQGEHEEDEVRFALTSEAGLNDGLAFPFTNLAVAMALSGGTSQPYVMRWLLVDVGYKLVVGAAVGAAVGFVLARIVLALPARTDLAKAMVGLSALAITLLVYGSAEYAGGYGFLAVFVAAVVVRGRERDHAFHASLHMLTEQVERLLTMVLLLAIGASLTSGVLDALTLPDVMVALLAVFVVRPFAGIVSLWGSAKIPPAERLAIGFYGIRGIGSLYYLAYAMQHARFEGIERAFALVLFTLVLSAVVHGVSAGPVMTWLDRRRERTGGNRATPAPLP